MRISGAAFSDAPLIATSRDLVHAGGFAPALLRSGDGRCRATRQDARDVPRARVRDRRRSDTRVPIVPPIGALLNVSVRSVSGEETGGAAGLTNPASLRTCCRVFWAGERRSIQTARFRSRTSLHLGPPYLQSGATAMDWLKLRSGIPNLSGDLSNYPTGVVNYEHTRCAGRPRNQKTQPDCASVKEVTLWREVLRILRMLYGKIQNELCRRPTGCAQ
jgi:hypothetical protein